MTAIITMLVLLGLMQLYGLLIMLGMSKTVDSTRSDVATIVDTFVPQENSYHGEVNMVKRETDIVGITEGQYGFSPRYNESFVAIKTIDDKVLKDVIEYSRKNKFAFHSETSCEGENIRYRISININKQPMVKLRDFFDFMTNLEKKIEGNNVKITTTEEIVRTR